MTRRRILLLVIAILTGLGTIQVARQVLQQPGEPTIVKVPQLVERPPSEHQVLVARSDLPIGTLLSPDVIRWEAWPDDADNTENFIKQGEDDATAYHGSVVRATILAGEPVLPARLVKPGERGFLAAVLNPGMRAITISITSTTGIAGFVFPGDQVDLLLTHEVGPSSGKARRTTETVLTELRVLAIDQTTNDQLTAPVQGKLVTLEVTPKQAELVTLMSGLGTLSLSLRSITLPATAEVPAQKAEESGGLQLRAAGAPSPAEQRSAGRSASAMPYAQDSHVSSALRRLYVVRGDKREETTF